MTDVLVSLEIGLEDKSDAHRILPRRGHVDRGPDRASKFELVGLDRNQLDERHFVDQLLRVLVVEAILVSAPSGSLQVHALDVGAVLEPLLDGRCVLDLGYHGI